MKIHGGRYKFRYKYKVMLSLAIFSFLTISAIGTYLFYSYRDHQFSRLIESSKTNVEQVSSQVDERLENVKRYYLASVTDSEVQDILEKDITYSDYTMIKDARESLAGNGIFIDYISGYSLINYRTEWVICNKGMYQLDSLINSDEVMAIYNSIDASQIKNFWYYQASNENDIDVNDAGYRETVLLSGLSFILKLPLSNPQIYGMLIANINMNELYGWMQDGLLDEEEIVVLDNEGNLIFSSDSKFTEICRASEEGEWKDIVTVDNNKYILAKSDSKVLGWTYFVVSDWNRISGETFKYSLSITILLFAVILGIVTILIFYIIYTPIKTLAKKASDTNSNGKGNPRDELELLELSLENLEGSNAQLEAKVTEQRSRVMELFFLRMLRGDMTEAEMDSYLERFVIARHLEYQTMMVFLREKEGESILSAEEKDHICYELIQNMSKQLSRSLSIQPVFYTHGLLFVFQEGNKNVNLHLIMEIFDELEKYVEEKYHMMIGAGVSLEHSDFYELGKAYKESMAALIHLDTKNKEDDSEIDQEDSLPEASYSYLRYYRRNKRQGREIYDVTYENEMKAAILCCDKEQILEAVNHFFRYLKEQELTRENTIFYLMQFIDRTIKDFVEFGIDVSSVYKEGISNIYTHILQFYQLDELREYMIKALYLPSIEAQESINDGQSHIILVNLLDYIEEKKGNVTLAECSTHLSYHPTYLWKILKNEKNMTFSEYLEQYKISLAKKLLLETDMTVSEISKQFDYTNVQNFIRFFNKACGVTPGKFRSMNR